MKRVELGFTFLLLPLDCLAVTLSLLAAYALREQIAFFPLEENRLLLRDFSFLRWYLPLLIFFYSTHRLYYLQELKRKLEMLSRVLSATASGAMLYFLAILVGRTAAIESHYTGWHRWAMDTSLLTVLYFWLTTCLIVFLSRVIYVSLLSFLQRHGVGNRRILLVGNTDLAHDFLRNLKIARERGITILGTVRTRPGKSGTLPILGELDDFPQILDRYRPDEVLEADPDLTSEAILPLIEATNERQCDFAYIPNLFEVRASNVAITTVGSLPVVHLRRTPLDGWGRILKRLIDIATSLLALVVLSPLLLVVALLIKLQDGGTVLFANTRVSQGKRFTMYKFRSMVPNAHEQWAKLRETQNERKDGPLFKLKRDPRVTPLGQVLRKSRIDELPQLINVLRGDMSLVGPRPHLPEEVAEYQKHHKKVLAIRPGLTGVAQISGSSDLNFEEEVRLDTYYIENWSLLKDIEIILKTPFVILFKDRSGC